MTPTQKLVSQLRQRAEVCKARGDLAKRRYTQEHWYARVEDAIAILEGRDPEEAE